MRYQKDPRQIGTFLHEGYSATTTLRKATVPSTLAQMRYTGQPMHEYVSKWKSCAGQLASMDSPVKEGLIVTMITECFSRRSKSPYGMALRAWLTKENTTWHEVSVRLLQEYRLQYAKKLELSVGGKCVCSVFFGEIKREEEEKGQWKCLLVL